MKQPDYTYKAKVLRWVDGDTVWLDTDMGMRIHTDTDFRLFGINTPERGKLNFSEATNYARHLAPEGSFLTVKTYKNPEKYGRWLAQLYLDDTSINDALVASGLAVPYYP